MSKWTPQQDQTALTLAAIRWYTISLEKLANGIYITHPERYPDVSEILQRAFRELGRVRKTMSAVAPGDEGCPPGYVDCNGACLPDCDPMEY